jgi:pimeloyl-ACP methyl ester carboxylesterase
MEFAFTCQRTLTGRMSRFVYRASWWLAVAVVMAVNPVARAGAPLHAEVLVFVPAYEASQLFDPTLNVDPSDDPVCVWGNYNVFLSSKRYFSLRTPNPLIPRPLLAVGPIDVYRKFVSTMTTPCEGTPGFSPYTLGSDFFIFTYDWRQEMATVSAPELGKALENYAAIHERQTGIPARDTKFIIITHSMGGLVARTLLAESPLWASRISRMYLVGSPNLGSVKAVRTVIVGPDSLQEYTKGFPGFLLNLIPTDVDQNVTKLVGITRLSLYELLPWGDPRWVAMQDDGRGLRRTGSDVLRASSWEPYWPSARLEKTLFLDGWLKDREEEHRKQIDPAAWEYCQDPEYAKLKTIMAQVSSWRQVIGRLSDTVRLMSGGGEGSRLRVIYSTGVKTPSGVVSEGSHDRSEAYYTYDAENDGDGTVEAARVIDDVAPTSPIFLRIEGVPHGRLMISSQFLDYFTKELSGRQMAVDHVKPKAAAN